MPMELKEALAKAEELLNAKESLESALGIAQKEYLHHVNSVLPAVLNEIGIDQCATEHFVFKLKRKVSAKIHGDNIDAAMEWLRKHGGDHMIRRLLTAEFALGEDERANLTRAALMNMDVPLTDKQSVHHATLAKWVGERLETGMEVEEELLGVHVFDYVKMEKQ